MGKSDLALLIVIIVGFFTLSVYVITELMKQIRNEARKDLQAHQDWLFNQLYTMAPGKVLKPDEVEPEESSEPATVYIPAKDPMLEFKGKKSDWF